jgi:hypothetical protein
MAYVDKNVIMEDVYILPGQWRNFGGHVTRFNDSGKREFAVSLEDSVAKAMADDGWTSVKFPKGRDDDEEDTRGPVLKVTISYKGRPPRIVMRTSKNRVPLGENEIEMLDYANILTADMIIRPYNWSARGDTGIAAYLQSLYVTIEEDYLEQKYAAIDEEQKRRERG